MNNMAYRDCIRLPTTVAAEAIFWIEATVVLILIKSIHGGVREIERTAKIEVVASNGDLTFRCLGSVGLDIVSEHIATACHRAAENPNPKKQDEYKISYKVPLK